MADDPQAPRRARWTWRRVLLAGLLGSALGAAVAVFAVRSLMPPPEERPALPPIPPGEVDPVVWGQYYPRHLDSYNRGYEMAATAHGGSIPGSKLARMPYLVRLFAGYGFAEEYNEDRGHPYSLDDVVGIHQKRKPAAVCFTCKTAQLPALLEKYGTEFYNLPFDQVQAEIQHPVACADCHDPNTMALRITRPALIDALRRRGTDVATLSRQEMRTMVCAQCHVEYYFKPGTREVVFPWDRGLKVDDVEAYYDAIGFADWTHAESGAALIKIQHPDYEFFTNGTHAAAGVSCSDCHMPFMKEGNVKITSHWWTSPLKHVEQSCNVCHRQSADYLKQRVSYIQEKTYGMMNTASAAMVDAIDAIQAAAADPDVDAERLTAARALHRRAQIRLDWINAENSMGFHNSQEALEVLGRALDLAHQARLTALQSRGAVAPPAAAAPGAATPSPEDAAPGTE